MLKTEQKDKFLIVHVLEKRLDASIAPDFKDEMKALIANGQQYIILDLSQTDFLDSSGLGAIVSTLKLLKGEGDLILCGVQGAVISLFKLTRMDNIFSIYPTVTDAIANAA
ncbi:STAS domain-containing protein [Beggiatoa leptomitoformis]|uniref:Anti-sigma factor antagonist n=1 Tax=Beggiatoa leptomitoformis TaxID=288004 RepID=A0A2N9YDV8_9GAMM|nr:STAS domain-containing protein [Beggiatoa leptomitoformis]ALG68971.1 anti-sigma factor antagonist [Beggiatoa leptomitoformis]AUI68636.1 anti-sigma factor antagonist [Beggiatoa leptomitoformis]